MEPYPDLCELVRDNKFKVTNMQTWSHIHIYVSDNIYIYTFIALYIYWTFIFGLYKGTLEERIGIKVRCLHILHAVCMEGTRKSVQQLCYIKL